MINETKKGRPFLPEQKRKNKRIAFYVTDDDFKVDELAMKKSGRENLADLYRFYRKFFLSQTGMIDGGMDSPAISITEENCP